MNSFLSSRSSNSGDGVAALISLGVPYSTLMGILWSGTVFSFIVLCLRLAFRIKILGRLRLDDYLVIVSFLICFASTLLWAVLARSLYDSIESLPYLDLSKLLDLFNKYSSTFGAILPAQVRTQQILWWSVFVYIIATYFITVGLMDYQCLTSKGLDIAFKCSNPATLDYEYAAMRAQQALDITTDIFIVFVSGNIIWRASINWKKKFILSCICCLTIAMVVVAALRLSLGLSKKAPDLSWLLLWNSVEMTLAIFVACAASFRSLYCHTKHSQQKNSLKLQSPSKWSQDKMSNFNATDTMIEAEVSLWESKGLADLSHSEEELWDRPRQTQPSQRENDAPTIMYAASVAHQQVYVERAV
ncbi:hypothetical protein QBC38DRAFT_505518 [Podospora fimiseda]|uniref:Rhodopsin domain-containing protein n=1 Tax=Podospora fimiseda TaxID=252190 RepID=A0AAN6YMX2_9PEZI|nr:hypothetical protein QBC38DRAFT_505518 [Podospora fimiseda]